MGELQIDFKYNQLKDTLSCGFPYAILK